MSPDRLAHQTFLTLKGDAWEDSRVQKTSSKGATSGDASRNCKKKNSSPSKVRRNQTHAQLCSFSTIDKALSEEVPHRECATKLKNLSLGHKDRNSSKVIRTLSPVRKGSFVLQPNSSTQRKEMSGHSPESHLRNTKSASNLKEPSKSPASQSKLFKLSLAIRDSPSNQRPVARIISPGYTVLEKPTRHQGENISPSCHQSACYSTAHTLFWKDDRLPALTDSDEDSASDLSDSERIPIISTSCNPPDLKLQAEVIAPMELALMQPLNCIDFSYPDVLPEPYAGWDLRELSLLVNMRNPLTTQPLGLLESFVQRLLELEWLQLRTEETERSKSIRLRSNIAPRSCHSARNPARGKNAVCNAASICSHCQLQYPYCNGACHPYTYQIFSHNPSVKHHRSISQLKGVNQSKTWAKDPPLFRPKELMLGKGALAKTHSRHTPAAVKTKTCKEPPCPVQCPPPSTQVHFLRPGRSHWITDTHKIGSVDKSMELGKDFYLKNKIQRIRNPNKKERRPRAHPK